MKPADSRHTFPAMEPERNEVYERIPWETLDRRTGDRQWLIIAMAGAVAVGALAYSFMRGQPVAPPATPETVTQSAAPIPPPTAPAATTDTAATSPMVVAEEDLYALETDHLADVAASHAEWFAVEYISVDGSEQSRQTLASLLPAGVPLPEAPADTQVFVDWAGASSVTEIDPVTFLVDVMVRSLVSRGDEAFTRQPVSALQVEVVISDDGLPRIALPPRLSPAPATASAPLSLSPVPEPVLTQVETSHGPVVGGEAQPDGSWLVVAMVTGPDQVARPVTVAVP